MGRFISINVYCPDFCIRAPRIAEGRRGTRTKYRVNSLSALGGGEGRGEVGERCRRTGSCSRRAFRLRTRVMPGHVMGCSGTTNRALLGIGGMWRMGRVISINSYCPDFCIRAPRIVRSPLCLSAPCACLIESSQTYASRLVSDADGCSGNPGRIGRT